MTNEYDYLKTKRVLKGNLHNLFTMLMTLCDTEVRNQVKALFEYKDIKCAEEDTVKMANKKGSNFLVLKKERGQYSNIQEDNDKESEDDPEGILMMNVNWLFCSTISCVSFKKRWPSQKDSEQLRTISVMQKEVWSCAATLGVQLSPRRVI